MSGQNVSIEAAGILFGRWREPRKVVFQHVSNRKSRSRVVDCQFRIVAIGAKPFIAVRNGARSCIVSLRPLADCDP